MWRPTVSPPVGSTAVGVLAKAVGLSSSVHSYEAICGLTSLSLPIATSSTGWPCITLRGAATTIVAIGRV